MQEITSVLRDIYIMIALLGSALIASDVALTFILCWSFWTKIRCQEPEALGVSLESLFGESV